MSDANEKNGSTQMWMVSLAISVFCCALFFAFLSMYVNDVSKTLASIDERLANIENKTGLANLVAPPSTPVAIPAPPAAEIQPVGSPVPIEAPVPAETPAAAPATPDVPAAAPAPAQ